MEQDMQKPVQTKVSQGTWVVIIALCALLIATGVAFWWAMTQGRLPAITIHGWIAMGIGIFFSMLIGCGLMFLSFYSAREGYDDRADPGRLSRRRDGSDT
jgi:hypothetical protein